MMEAMAVCGYFPEEIIEEILLKLPIESLLRCIAVCKSWNFLIKSPSFIQTQLSRTIQSNIQNQAHLLLLREIDRRTVERTSSFSLYWDNPNSLDVCRTLTEPSAINTTVGVSLPLVSFRVLGTCNGLVCLSNCTYDIALIWNPLVRKFAILPSPSVTVTASGITWYAFGYDSRTNDYKVLRTVVYYSDRKPSNNAEVWSLQRANWRSLDARIPPDFGPHNNSLMPYPFVNGALHWVNSFLGVIETFDMSDELFGRIMMPELLTKDVNTLLISNCRESLALLTDNENSVHVWVMQEYGVTETWTQLLTLPLQGWLSWPMPLCFRESGDVVFGIRKELQSVDVKSKEAKQIPNACTNYVHILHWSLCGEPCVAWGTQRYVLLRTTE